MAAEAAATRSAKSHAAKVARLVECAGHSPHVSWPPGAPRAPPLPSLTWGGPVGGNDDPRGICIRAMGACGVCRVYGVTQK